MVLCIMAPDLFQWQVSVLGVLNLWVLLPGLVSQSVTLLRILLFISQGFRNWLAYLICII
jgi:hypothetical protein